MAGGVGEWTSDGCMEIGGCVCVSVFFFFF